MCWSMGASIAATALGGAATVYAVKKKVPKERAFALGFFTFMELLQAVSYLWIGQCDLSANKFLTYLGFIHIAFQIPVANAFMLSFVSKKTRKKWYKPVMIASFIGTFLMLTKLVVPLLWDAPREWMCKIGDPLCGTDACTYKGNWHLAWRLPLFGYGPSSASIYFGLVFILPILYGNWRISAFHFIFGPLLAYVVTMNSNEAAAVWCLFSIVIICSIFTPLKTWFETPMRKK